MCAGIVFSAWNYEYVLKTLLSGGSGEEEIDRHDQWLNQERNYAIRSTSPTSKFSTTPQVLSQHVNSKIKDAESDTNSPYNVELGNEELDLQENTKNWAD